MIGYKTLAVPGPTNMPYEVQRAMEVPLEDHRAPDFPNFTLPLFADLKTIFQTETGRVFVFPGSGTGGWEAAISNLLSAGDKVLTSSFGQFSTLWVNMCRDFGLDVQNFDVTWGEGVPLEDYHSALANDKGHAIKAVLVCHNETATGVTSDVRAVRQILDDLDHPALLFVDGVSSVGSLDFRMEEWGVDVAVSGSQKGFMMPTGLCIVGVSRKALEACSTSRFPTGYFSFQEMMKMNDQGYFPYTPAATLLRGLRASIDLLKDEGLSKVASRHNRLASGVRAAVDAWGLSNCALAPKWYSDTVTAIVVPKNHNANDVINAAYHNYGVSLGGGLGKVAGKVFRIGHLGWLNETMVLRALGGVEMAMRDAGIPFQAGSGVGAAVEYYSDTRQSLSLAAE
ncbi:aminotransferase class V-fold PLP-dependent enzyme [Alphaproteobacteria bacterium]|jgi:alanine-glyoxylate transaminase/serine-glyoxylate transaminase/serine-pyruvate transaminase|nr:aminotransferase class V-fold PLP-dependent enzyme [Alphaproteobacteria bacterium]